MSNFVFSEGNANIYKEFKPASKNLFEIELMDTNTAGAYIGTGFDPEAINTYARFHAVDVKIDDEYLSLKRNPISKLFQVSENESYIWADKLTIKWRESSDWEVRNYHEWWISSIYDKENDVYRASAIHNPYRTIIINLPGSYKLECEGILPRNIGRIDLAWGKGGSIVEPQLDYYVTKIKQIKKG